MATPTHPEGKLTDLHVRLSALDGRRYAEYKSVKGRYAADDLELLIDHVQGDPFAKPSRVRLRLPARITNLPVWAIQSADRRRGSADFLHRVLYGLLRASPRGAGSGRSGELDMSEPGQQVLTRTALLLGVDGAVEIRLGVGLPAEGRRILGAAAAELLCGILPSAIREALRRLHADTDALRRHVETVEDAVHLRGQLGERGLVAFVADGAHLPRASGVDDAPLSRELARAIRAPERLAVTLRAPNAGPLRGLGIPRGITLVVGGGYHGKSTLLRALERGVYDHLPGDGRERVVTDANAVKVRAEDGRAVAGTDISNFIGVLPAGEHGARFSSANASGSTSQAASIVEALEAGATCLLLDEDTSAANFLTRDARMQRLIAREDEPITAFIDRARTMHERLGVSVVMVAGGSGDFFEIADTVIAMKEYQPEDVTDRTKEIARELPSVRMPEGGAWRAPESRALVRASIDPLDARGRTEIRWRSGRRMLFGREEVDLSGLEQIVETAQLEALAWALVRVARQPERDAEIASMLRATMAEIEREGLDVLHPEPLGGFAEFRVFELAGFLNRIRSLRVEDVSGTRVARADGQADDNGRPGAADESDDSLEV